MKISAATLATERAYIGTYTLEASAAVATWRRGEGVIRSEEILLLSIFELDC